MCIDNWRFYIMIHPSRSQFPTTAMMQARILAEDALSREHIAAHTPVSSNVIPHGIPGSGTCKWQCVWEMADGSIQRFPASVRE